MAGRYFSTALRWGQMLTGVFSPTLWSIHPTFQIEMDILLPAISHENEPSFSARMCCTHSVQCSSLATFHMACTDFEPVLECGAPSVLQNRTQGAGISPSPSQAGGAPLFAIRVCLLLVVPFFFSSVTVWAILEAFQCWWRKQGAISPPHMWLQLRKRKGPQSRGPLWLAALFEIPPSRCYTNWTHFQLLKERRKWGANLPAASLQPFLKWSTIRLSLCFAVSQMIPDPCCQVFLNMWALIVLKFDPLIIANNTSKDYWTAEFSTVHAPLDLHFSGIPQ